MSRLESHVDYVLDRMVETVLGESALFNSHALALGIPENTIRTWKRRGEVPLSYLKNFAQDWKVSLDWLLNGNKSESHQVNENPRPYGLTADESALLESFRRRSPEAQAALLLLVKDASGARKTRTPVGFGDPLPTKKKRGPIEFGDDVKPISHKNKKDKTA